MENEYDTFECVPLTEIFFLISFKLCNLFLCLAYWVNETIKQNSLIKLLLFCITFSELLMALWHLANTSLGLSDTRPRISQTTFALFFIKSLLNPERCHTEHSPLTFTKIEKRQSMGQIKKSLRGSNDLACRTRAKCHRVLRACRPKVVLKKDVVKNPVRVLKKKNFETKNASKFNHSNQLTD